MTLKDELQAFVDTTFATGWSETETTVVPDSDSLPMSNTAKVIEGTVLYADMADSTGLVASYQNWFAADIFKNYLYCASRAIRFHGGTITAFDGDRVMAVFSGDARNSSAVAAAFLIQGAVVNIIRPSLTKLWPDEKYVLRQKVGIDTSKLFVAQTGMRGNRDLVWVGNAANNAAKMAALGTTYATYITGRVLDDLPDRWIYGGEPRRKMWTNVWSSGLPGQVHGSDWMTDF